MRSARVLASQPNVLAVSRSIEFSPKFWLILLATGVAAGLAGGALMRLLYAVQHLAWQASPSGLYEGVVNASPLHRVLVLGGAGVVVAAGVTLLGFVKGGHSGELTVALWFHAGQMPWLRTLGRCGICGVWAARRLARGEPFGFHGRRCGRDLALGR